MKSKLDKCKIRNKKMNHELQDQDTIIVTVARIEKGRQTKGKRRKEYKVAP